MKKNLVRFWAFLISVNLHIFLLLFIAVYRPMPENYVTEDGIEIEWVELDENDDSLEKRQIVEQDDNQLNDETPLKDYKLSKHNQRVLRESQAAHHGKYQNTENTAKEKPKVAVVVPAKTNEASQEKPNKQTDTKGLSLADFKPSMLNNQYKPRNIASVVATGGPVSQTDDYLKDVKVGAQTLLNTREFVYYSYYSRIKGKLRQHWGPKIYEKLLNLQRQGRRIASATDKITRLVITLNTEGRLVRVQIKGASGYNDLDDAAVEAFRAAAPFPNPPAGIVDKKGEIRINWDFVLET